MRDLEALLVEPEHPGDGYQRKLFDHWIDDDHDGCDTRCEVLTTERRADLPGLTPGWLSLYDGYTTDLASDLEVDHVVALAEAWQSGADTWTSERRRAFANDLDHPDALIAVSIASNQSKADRDAASWQPPNPAAACWWASAVIEIKLAWHLSVDRREATALAHLLQTC